MVFAMFVAAGSLMVGLVKLFAPDPYEEFSWISTTRRVINFAAVPVLALWVLTAQTNLGPNKLVQSIPAIGALELSAHTVALLYVTAALKARCADGPHRNVPSLRSVVLISVLCVAIIAASAAERDIELLRVLWIVWLTVVGLTSMSLGPKVRRESTIPLDQESTAPSPPP